MRNSKRTGRERWSDGHKDADVSVKTTLRERKNPSASKRVSVTVSQVVQYREVELDCGHWIWAGVVGKGERHRCPDCFEIEHQRKKAAAVGG